LMSTSFRLKVCLLPLIFAAFATSARGAFVENFDDIATLAGKGWVAINRSSPVGTQTWQQGDGGLRDAVSGAADAYIADTYASAGTNATQASTISDWLISPPLTLNNGDVLSFFTFSLGSSDKFPDRLQVWFSTN